MRKKIAVRRKRRAKEFSVTQLYKMCKVDRPLIDELFDDLDSALKARKRVLPEKCHKQVKDLVDKHKNSEWLDRIKKDIGDQIWKDLPIYVTKAVLTPPCPWGGCPPPTR